MVTALDFGERIVQLPGVLAWICVVAVLWLAIKGKLGALAGLFSAGCFWMSGFHVGFGMSLLMLLLGGLALGTLRYLVDSSLMLTFSTQSLGLVFWLASWWSWIGILLAFNRPSVGDQLFRVLVGFIVPLTVAAIFVGRDVDQVQAFARGFVLASLCGVVAGLWWLGITYRTLLAEPFTPLALHLGRENYHETAIMTVCAFGFCLASIRASKTWLGKLAAFVGSLALAYAVILIGARQGFVGLAIVFIVWFVWSRSGEARLGHALALIASGLVVAVILLEAYRAFPDMLKLGESSQEAGDVGNLFRRAEFFAPALNKIAASPLFGTGFHDYNLAHNLFLEALLDQGIVGLIFLLGLLVVLAKSATRAWALRGSDARSHWSGALVATLAYTLSVMLLTGGLLGAYHLYAFSILLVALAFPGSQALRSNTTGA